MVITMSKKIIIVLIALVVLIVGVVLCVGRGGTSANNTDGTADAVIDSETISVENVTVDKSGDLVYNAPTKRPAETDGHPVIWIE